MVKEKIKEECECNDDCCDSRNCNCHRHGNADAFGAFYFLGLIGTAVYYVQQVHGFWPVILAVLKAIVWPAFLLYKVFTMLHM